MKVFRKGFWLAFFIVALLGLSVIFFRVEADSAHIEHGLPTYYTYPTENLSSLHSTLLMQEWKLEEWEDALNTYFIEHDTPYLKQLRLYTYLYLSQRDAAFLSYNIHQCFIGSLDPLTERIISLFLPDFTNFPPLESDTYSEALADVVFEKYHSHYEEEEKSTNTLHSECWYTEVPETFKHVAKWIAWIKPLPNLPPPTPLDDKQGWKTQISELKQARRYLSQNQIEIVHKWSGEKGFGHNWRILANQYMEEYRTPFAKVLLVRALLMMGLYDGMIKEITLKFTYCSPRPEMEDPSIKPLIKEPETPSYPSGHATQGAIFATILTHFFPDAYQHWHQLAKEAANSRLWAGVHFPQDIERGEELGKLIGNQVIDSMKDHP